MGLGFGDQTGQGSQKYCEINAQFIVFSMHLLKIKKTEFHQHYSLNMLGHLGGALQEILKLSVGCHHVLILHIGLPFLQQQAQQFFIFPYLRLPTPEKVISLLIQVRQQIIF